MMRIENQRILIADDDLFIRNVLFEFLLRKGFEVGLAQNGRQALQLFTNNSFDVVVTDYQMPQMNGLQLAAKIRQRQPKTVIVMMSADRGVKAKTAKVVNHFLEKPFKLRTIFELLDHDSMLQTCGQSPCVIESIH